MARGVMLRDRLMIDCSAVSAITPIRPGLERGFSGGLETSGVGWLAKMHA
jgi:hypothetical protein